MVHLLFDVVGNKPGMRIIGLKGKEIPGKSATRGA